MVQKKQKTLRKNMNFVNLYLFFTFLNAGQCNLFGNSIMKMMNEENKQEYWQPNEVDWQRFISSPNCVFDDLLCALKITYRK